MSATLSSVVAPPRLSCSGIEVNFGGLLAVNDVSISLPAREIVGLVGPNGAGKSTLFGVLSGLIQPSRGEVFLDGDNVTHASPQARAERGLARTFQHPETFAGLTVRQHFVLAHRIKVSKKRTWSDLFTLGSLRSVDAEEKRVVDELVETLGLGPVADRLAAGQPLGVSRLIELGRALATDPTVLLLDEPSSGLDSAETVEFESTLRRACGDHGVSVLIVEHDVELVMRLCSEINVLDFGISIARGTPEEIRNDPQVRAAYLGEETGSKPAGEGASESAAARTSTSAQVAPIVEAPPALEVEALCVHYGPAVALTGATFQIRSGEALAILGPNGAGKSSMARAISGLVPATSGSVRLNGTDITSIAPHRIRQAGVVHLPEGRGVFRRLSVMDNLKMATIGMHGHQARQDAVERVFEFFPTLAGRQRQIAGSLSGGEQQMLSVARSIVTAPTLLIADELSLGLAPLLVDSVFEGLSAAREAGVTVIIIEQYVHRALELADQCLVLQRGEVAWQGEARGVGDDVLRHYLGESMTAVQ